MRTLTARTPVLTPVPREFDDFLGRFFGNPIQRSSAPTTGRWLPPLESFVRDGEVVVRIDVPGVDLQTLDVSAEKDRLTVKGERRSTRAEHPDGRA